MEYKELINKAYLAMKNSYAPYSNFKVGASVLTKKGNIYLGCNVENVSFGATNCAERTAIFSAVALGEKNFIALAVCDSSGKDFPSPCGICRQVLMEFNPDMDVILCKTKSDYKIVKAKDLLPNAFNKNNL